MRALSRCLGVQPRVPMSRFLIHRTAHWLDNSPAHRALFRAIYGLLAAFPAALLITSPLHAAPGIADLYQKALKNDTQFHAANARHEAAVLAPGIARAQLLPQLSLKAGLTHIPERTVRGVTFLGPGDFSYNVDNLSINLTQTLFHLGAYIELKQSRSQFKRATLELEAARQDLILRLAESYFNVLSAEETLKFTRSEKEAVERQLEQARERFDVGLAPITDVKEAEAEYDLAVAEEISADNQLHNAIHTLTVIIDHDVEALRPLIENISTPKPQPDNMQQWEERALAQNLDLLAQQISANIAAQEVELQRSQHYPSLNLVANRNETEIHSGSRTPQEIEEYTVGVELEMPIFAGGGTRYRTRQAAQLHREALEQLKGKHRETQRAAREAYLNVLSSISRVAALKRAEESAQAALESNEAGFQVGTRDSVDVLVAVRDLFRTRRDYAEVRYEYLLNTLRLKKVAGLLSELDITQLDGYLRDER